MALRLYVKMNGKMKPVSALMMGPHLKPVLKTRMVDAIKKYNKICGSKHTEKNQRTDNKYFERMTDFLKAWKIRHVDEVNLPHMMEFQTGLSLEMKASSVNRRFKTIKNFFNMCEEWKISHHNPCQKLKRLKEEKNSFKPWSRDLFNRFMKKTDGVHKKIFEFLWLTGCRPYEALNLKWTDIDHENHVIKFRTKKNGEISREFPIDKRLSKLLHSIRLDSLYVFSVEKRVLSTDNLYQYAKHRLIKLGFNSFTVYGLRHAFASRLANKKVNSGLIMVLMGHSSIETTEGYMHFNQSDKIKALKSA